MNIKELQPYILKQAQGDVESCRFRLRVKELAEPILKAHIDKKLTRREGNKILAEVLKEFPTARFYMKDESYSFEFVYQLDGYNSPEGRLYFTSLMGSNKLYTQDKHDSLIADIGHVKGHLAEAQGKLDNILELIELYHLHDVQREELAKRQALELETFSKQAKCPNTDLEYLIKHAKEAQRKAQQEAYYRKQHEEFEARMAGKNCSGA